MKDILVGLVVVTGGIAMAIAVVILVFSITEGSSAAELEYQRFTLADGRPVHCKRSVRHNCGMSLTVCVDNREYFCQTNLRKERGDNDVK